MPGNRGQIWQAMVVGMRARIGTWHGGDDSGLHHPLQVLAGSDGVQGRNKSVARSWHIYPEFLEDGERKSVEPELVER